ncbi:hypothetical protein Q9233_009874 [Columba guinea]|nr:hypothetical protein Q9233_009874 [Columba guinea]
MEKPEHLLACDSSLGMRGGEPDGSVCPGMRRRGGFGRHHHS